MKMLTLAEQYDISNRLLMEQLLGTIQKINQSLKEANEQIAENKLSDEKNYPKPYDQTKEE